MKERISGLRNESSKTKRTGLFQRITAAFLLPLIIIYKKVSSTFLPNLSVFWHINEGIEEIMADYVHQTRNLILVYLRLFLLIVIKDVFLSLVSFLNKSKNLMDRTSLFPVRAVPTYSTRKNIGTSYEWFHWIGSSIALDLNPVLTQYGYSN
jgi:succinate dehydrogenase hydrophobic anchor subunit